MEDVPYRIRLMPRAAETYLALKSSANKLPADPYSPDHYKIRPYTKMFGRVNSILCSLMDPGNLHLDQPLLESLGPIHTRTLESTLIYFFRMNEERLIGVLHITEYDSTNSYARFCAFMDHGGWRVFADLGFDLPSVDIGSSGMIH
jgi:hypothetical protein